MPVRTSKHGHSKGSQTKKSQSHLSHPSHSVHSSSSSARPIRLAKSVSQKNRPSSRATDWTAPDSTLAAKSPSQPDSFSPRQAAQPANQGVVLPKISVSSVSSGVSGFSWTSDPGKYKERAEKRAEENQQQKEQQQSDVAIASIQSDWTKETSWKAEDSRTQEQQPGQYSDQQPATVQRPSSSVTAFYRPALQPSNAPLSPSMQLLTKYSNTAVTPAFMAKVEEYKTYFDQVRQEMHKIVVGQPKIIDALFEALLSNGHVLVEGIPGIAKTLIIRTLSIITGCQFSRIQFTPDLLPTDIVGITTYEEGKGFYTVKGPIFANFVLADEINRSPPKVQSALLEAMQEKQVTIGKESFKLPTPFFVMATQNPVENLGTYKLPEAQIDRFIYKLMMTYPGFEDEVNILHKNITLNTFEDFNLRPVMSQTRIMQAQQDVKQVYMDKKIERYIVRLIDATRNAKKYGIELGKYIEYGCSPRSSIALFISSKSHAFIQGRPFVTPQDVKDVAHDVLRHRLLLNYEGQAEEIDTDMIIDEVLKKVPIIS